MLLSLRSNPQIQKYLYKIVMVYAQAISITWSKLVPSGAVICHSRCLVNFKRWLIMLLYWYACIYMNTGLYMRYHISLETVWWALSNTSSIMWICPAIHEILANKAFAVTNGLISQFFVVAFVHPTYVWIVLIWSFPAQLSLWKLVY